MRKRIIRKIGNSFYAKLEQADMRDLNLDAGDYVEIKATENNCKETNATEEKEDISEVFKPTDEIPMIM